MSGFNPDPSFLDFELGISARRKKKKKKRKTRRKRILKKLGKGLAIAATGGLAGAKLTKVGRRVTRKVKGRIKKARSKLGGKLKVSLGASSRRKMSSKGVVKAVRRAKPSDCANVDEMVKLVAAQLVAKLGAPMQHANQMLEQEALQRQATYEHQKLMSDYEFKKLVVDFIRSKANEGNQSCVRTLRILHG